jgi:hypothetical protein
MTQEKKAVFILAQVLITLVLNSYGKFIVYRMFFMILCGLEKKRLLNHIKHEEPKIQKQHFLGRIFFVKINQNRHPTL